MSPTTWHRQDWLLVLEALASGTHPDDESTAATRRRRLIEFICQAYGIDATAYVFEIDDDWSDDRAAEARRSGTTATELEPAIVSRLGDDDWQQVADTLAVFADRDTETTRTERAATLVESVVESETSVSLPDQ